MNGDSDDIRELRISTSQADAGCVVVTVCDPGPGFASQNPEQALAPFFTAKPTGLGMRLSICRSIIDAHGGELSIGNGVPPLDDDAGPAR